MIGLSLAVWVLGLLALSNSGAMRYSANCASVIEITNNTFEGASRVKLGSTLMCANLELTDCKSNILQKKIQYLNHNVLTMNILHEYIHKYLINV